MSWWRTGVKAGLVVSKGQIIVVTSEGGNVVVTSPARLHVHRHTCEMSHVGRPNKQPATHM